MVNNINPNLPIQPGGDLPGKSGKPNKVGGASFHDFLVQKIDQVNQLQSDADSAIEQLVLGETENVGEVMAALEKADIAFKLLMQIRNKLVDAYEEISRMRV